MDKNIESLVKAIQADKTFQKNLSGAKDESEFNQKCLEFAKKHNISVTESSIKSYTDERKKKTNKKLNKDELDAVAGGSDYNWGDNA